MLSNTNLSQVTFSKTNKNDKKQVKNKTSFCKNN